MMTTERATGPYPYAGVPWFNTPFGRDGIVTALECLWLRPELARGVLAYLASTQAMEFIPSRTRSRVRSCTRHATARWPRSRKCPLDEYYGSVDATPLFVVLAGAYYERTGDRNFIESIWPNIEAALSWIEHYGDRDGDGFVEYQRRVRKAACCIRVGEIQTTQSSTPTACRRRTDRTLRSARLRLCGLACGRGFE